MQREVSDEFLCHIWRNEKIFVDNTSSFFSWAPITISEVCVSFLCLLILEKMNNKHVEIQPVQA